MSPYRRSTDIAGTSHTAQLRRLNTNSLDPSGVLRRAGYVPPRPISSHHTRPFRIAPRTRPHVPSLDGARGEHPHVSRNGRAGAGRAKRTAPPARAKAAREKCTMR
jgi:hypothetical protein